MARRRRAGGAGRTSPCRGVGQRPTPFNPLISQNPFVSFVSFVISKKHWSLAGGSRPLIGSNRWTTEGLSSEAKKHRRFPISCLLCEPSWSFVHLRVSPAGQTSHSLPALCPSLSSSRACRALCSLFSVFLRWGRERRPQRKKILPSCRCFLYTILNVRGFANDKSRA